MKVKRYAGMLFWTTAATLGISAAQAGQMVVYDLGVDATGANSIGDVVSGVDYPGQLRLQRVVDQ